jgi:hypothetical protein
MTRNDYPNPVGEQINYRTYRIEPTTLPYGKGFDFFPADQGRDDDYDCVGDPAEYKYCGNVRHASTIEEAKNEIDCAIEEELVEACRAAVRYDEAIRSCGNDPDKMISFCTAAGERLDTLYMDWMTKSREALAKATALQNS